MIPSHNNFNNNMSIRHLLPIVDSYNKVINYYISLYILISQALFWSEALELVIYQYNIIHVII